MVDEQATGLDAPGPAAALPPDVDVDPPDVDVDEDAETESDGYPAYKEMRRARRARLLGDNEVLFDRFYQGYLTVFFIAIVTAYLAALLHEQPTTAVQLANVHSYAPPALGLAFVVCLALGARSGTRGGPLAVDPADVLYVLQSPIGRAKTLRPLAARKLASWMAIGLLVGASAGYLTSLRLPGGRGGWVGCGLLFGACAAGGAAAAAMVASGLRLRPRPVTAAAVGLTAWGCVAVALPTSAPPFGWLGQLALFPLVHRAGGFLLVAPVVVLMVAGLLLAPRVSLEAAERRAGLTSQIKFGLATRDFRTVIVVSRLLAQEHARGRPWLRLGHGAGRPFAVWKRDVQSLLRWPAGRVARVVALSLIAGLCARGAWSGVVWAIPVGGIVLWLVGVDICGAVAVEAEHSSRARLYPVPGGRLVLGHLAVPGVLALVAAVVAIGGAAMTGGSGRLLAVGAALVVPTVLATMGAGLVTDLQGEKEGLDVDPEILGPVYLVVDLIPLVIASVGLLPVFEAGVAARQGLGLASGDLAWMAVPVVLAGAVGCWAVVRGVR